MNQKKGVGKKAKSQNNKGKNKKKPSNTPKATVLNRNNEGNDKPVSPQYNEGAANKETCQSCKGSKRDKPHAIEWLNMIFTFVTAAGAIWAVTVASDTASDSEKFFETANRPYLQVEMVKDSGAVVFYKLANLGQYPAKIESGKFGIMPLEYPIDSTWAFIDNPAQMEVVKMDTGDDTINPKLLRPEPAFDPSIINTYVIKESPLDRSYKSPFPQTGGELMGRIKQDWYFFGDIIYTNEVTGSRRAYRFNIALGKKEFVLNKNIDLPK